MATEALTLEAGAGAALAPAPAPSTRAPEAKARLVLSDLAAVFVGVSASMLLYPATGLGGAIDTSEHLRVFLLTLPAWPVAFAHQLLYRARALVRPADEAWRIVKAVGAALAVLALVGYLLSVEIGRGWLFLAFASTAVTVGLERAAARATFARARRQGRLLREVVVVGRNAEGALVRDMLDSDRSYGYRVVGYLEDLISLLPGEDPVEALRRTDAGVEAVRRCGATGVVIAATAIDVGTSNRLVRAFTDAGFHVELTSTLCDISPERLTLRPLGRFPMVYVEPVRRGGWRAAAKRTFDVAGAATALVLTAPIMALCALAVRLTSPGPILFRQCRVGRDGQIFTLVKFRTMVADADAILERVRHLNEAKGPLFKIRNDPRVTPVGKLLRRTSLDELPQLYNVIKGEMSLVGPRPALPAEAARWEPSLRNRLRVRPGLTGMWQVSGRSDATDEYGRLDLYYVDNWNLVTDLVILARTVPAVLLQRGAC